MPVDTANPEYTLFAPVWQVTRDAAAGDPAVKKRASTYLATDFMESEPKRWEVYRDRAYFMGVTGRTEKAMIGMVFRKPANYQIPDSMMDLVEDFDGAGNSIDQVAKNALSGLLQTRRFLMLVDYPQVDGQLDRATEQAMGLRPTVAAYPAESLINWRFEGIKGQKKLTLAVLVEYENTSDDEFGHDSEKVYRVLRLVDGVYTQQLYDHNKQPKGDPVTPMQAGGIPFGHIPLHGVRDLEEPPLFSIAKVNLAQYRNIADLEDAAYTVGQPMVHVDIGNTSAETWKEHNPSGVKFGSRQGIITQGGSIELAQAAENNLVRQVKNDKQEEMVMLGAQLITRGGQAETAEAARIRAGAEASVLDMLVGDLSEDLEASLEDMARFLGLPIEGIEYKLNTDYWDSGLTPQALMAVIQGVNSRIYAQTDALHMIKTGRVQLEDGRDIEEIKEDVASSFVDEVEDDFNQPSQSGD